LVLAVFASTASAGVDLGLKGIGLRVGVVEPENLDTSLGFGFFMDLGTFHPNVAFETYVDYWSYSQDVVLAEASFRDIAVGAKGSYVFALANPRIRPFVGGGLSLHFLKSEATIPEISFFGQTIPGTTLDASDTKLGLDLGGGLRAGIADNFDITGELWYSFVPDVNQLSFAAGLLYRFAY